MNVTSRYNKAVAIVASDTVDFLNQGLGRKLCDALYVGGAGNVVVVLEDGTALTIAAIAGAILPFAARRVNATSTTATGLFALIAL